jgi:hypothetical protein
MGVDFERLGAAEEVVLLQVATTRGAPNRRIEGTCWRLSRIWDCRVRN